MNCINTKLCGGENKEEKKYHERVVGVVAMHIVLKMYIMP